MAKSLPELKKCVKVLTRRLRSYILRGSRRFYARDEPNAGGDTTQTEVLLQDMKKKQEREIETTLRGEISRDRFGRAAEIAARHMEAQSKVRAEDRVAINLTTLEEIVTGVMQNRQGGSKVNEALQKIAAYLAARETAQRGSIDRRRLVRIARTEGYPEVQAALGA